MQGALPQAWRDRRLYSRAVAIRQRVNLVTLGARDLSTLRHFDEGWGWRPDEGGSDRIVFFDVGGTLLALYPLDLLAAEAAPNAPLPSAGTWNGVVLSVNFFSRDEVDAALGDAVEAGAVQIGDPVVRSWGGYSGYVADPEGNRWELAWAPNSDPT